MNGSIFDAIDEPMTDTIFDVAEKVNPILPEELNNKEIPWYKSYASAAGKGLIQGMHSFGRALGPLQEPYDPEEVKKVLDNLLPSKEGFVEGALERGGKTFPLVATGGGTAANSLLRTGAAALSGETAKSLGASESVQSLVELPALIGPDLSKMIKSGKTNKELIEFARSKGMKEEEIAPLIQGIKKQRVLGKAAFKRGSESRLGKSKEAVGKIYEKMYSDPNAKKILPKQESSKIFTDIDDILLKMPKKMSKTITDDLQDLRNSPKAAEDFMNFYADVNATLSGNKKQISLLKDPITKAISTIDKQLGRDFKKTNLLYSKWAEISKTLKPTLASDIFEGSIPLRFGLGLKFPPIMGEVLIESLGKNAATELLLNPRLQGLGKRMVESINQNKIPAAQKIWNEMIDDVSKKDKNTAKKLKDIEFINLISSTEQ